MCARASVRVRVYPRMHAHAWVCATYTHGPRAEVALPLPSPRQDQACVLEYLYCGLCSYSMACVIVACNYSHGPMQVWPYVVQDLAVVLTPGAVGLRSVISFTIPKRLTPPNSARMCKGDVRTRLCACTRKGCGVACWKCTFQRQPGTTTRRADDGELRLAWCHIQQTCGRHASDVCVQCGVCSLTSG